MEAQPHRHPKSGGHEDKGIEYYRLAAIVDSSYDAIIGQMLDGTVTSWNKAAEKLYGYTAKEIVGRNIRLLSPPERHQEVEVILNQVREGERVYRRTERLKKDGSRVAVSLSAAPIIDAEGNTIGVSTIARDVTVQEKREEEARNASLYARTLIEASLDPIVTIDRDGKIMDVNKATEEVTGRSRDQLIGSDFANYFTDTEEARKGYRLVFERGFVRDYPLAFRHISGRVTDVLYNAALFKNAAGEVQGAFAAARDVSAQKQAEATIVRQREAIRELSTPVLQIRNGLLILPIIGMIDSYRARQLTDQLLSYIRATRAKVAVMDITGVPVVDSRVANHIVETIEASRLMGATVIVTGVSSEIAQTLVRIGVDLEKLNTVGDLQRGIEAADQMMGYVVIKQEEYEERAHEEEEDEAA